MGSLRQIHLLWFFLDVNEAMEYHIANGPVAVSQLAQDAQLPTACGHSGLSEEPLGLPSGYPSTLDSKLAWKGSDFQNEDSYICHLTNGDIAEVKSTLENFKGKLTSHAVLKQDIS